MQCLHKLAKNNQMTTIVVSIHSPNSDILELFDKIYILAKGGVCIYSDAPNLLDDKIDIERMDQQQQKPPIEEYMKIACNNINDNDIVRRLAIDVNREENERLTQSFIVDHEQLLFQRNWIIMQNRSFYFRDFYLQFYRMFHIYSGFYIFAKNFRPEHRNLFIIAMLIFNSGIYTVYYILAISFSQYRLFYNVLAFMECSHTTADLAIFLTEKLSPMDDVFILVVRSVIVIITKSICSGRFLCNIDHVYLDVWKLQAFNYFANNLDFYYFVIILVK
ncbi:hypothetical protein DERF_009648 [Dermatophagoides farinae]|uniref:Uncharacterized protein n=1 Tax=Dermatophagoides farinae TaxID=6954 RepID=A0A922L1Q9_DERFA|nr:hypothetical protein DERF_009648 [Dermatophagoides farinae]